MLVEPAFLGERFGAESARERSVASMHSHVLLDPALLGESLVADAAFEGFEFDVGVVSVVCQLVDGFES